MKKFTCPYCNKELENRSLHIEGENYFYCDDCDKIFYIEGNSLYEEGIDEYGSEYVSVLTDDFMAKAAMEEPLERLGEEIKMGKLYGNFAEFQKELNRTYGCPYGVGDQEDITSPMNLPEAWVICPQCQEPIYVGDQDTSKDYWDCPACCFVEDGEA